MTLMQRSTAAPQGIALRRIAIIAHSGAHVWRLRSGLVAGLRARRHGVKCFAHDYGQRDSAGLDALGVERAMLPPPSPGVQLFAERRSIISLAEQLSAFRPHSVLISGGQIGLQAAKAARKARVEQIVTLVNEVPGHARGDATLRGLARTLELTDVAVFHNADDPKTLRRSGMLPADLAYVVVPGAGVDLARYGTQPLPALADGLVFLMIARLDTAKGVLDYCEAARIVKARAPSARFLLAGPPGDRRTRLSVKDIAAFAECVTYLGELDDVREALARCHVYVYPSHNEGMPRSVLEAMAAGRPVITTDVPGCRDTVDERINGCLVPPSDPAALAAAMETFLKRPDLIPSIARASRAKAERRFDERAVNETLMGVMGIGEG